MSEEAIYRFLPWARRGLQPAYIDPLRGRIETGSSLPVTVRVDALSEDNETRGKGDTTVDLRLFGPGEVVGLDRNQIIRTVPTDGTVDFEPNFFPSVEFAQPDFAWAFSPARARPSSAESSGTRKPWWAGGGLRPWLCLVVVRESAAKLETVPTETGSSTRLTVPGSELPPPEETWAWAHVQVLDGRDSNDNFSGSWIGEQLTESSPLATSRLLSPRNLDANESYLACLVPTFDAGRESGLGREPPSDGVRSAWNTSDDAVTLPVYYSWQFKTGPNGDFESLVDRLGPGPVPRNVGFREIDVREPIPGHDILKVTGDDPPTITFGGALTSPTGPPRDHSYPSAKRSALRELLTTTTSEDGVPVVGPPTYGRGHVGSALPESDDENPAWLHQLNVDPENRAAAGLGTRVVQENQDQLMDQAWEQVGQLQEANQTLAQGVLGTMASERLHDRLATLGANDLKRLTRPFHDRLTVPQAEIRKVASESLPAQTVSEFLERGPAPTAVFSAPFARMVQAGSGPGRFIDRTDSTTTPAAFIERIDAGEALLPGQYASVKGQKLPNEVAKAMQTIIEERVARDEKRSARHGERLEEVDVLVSDLNDVRETLNKRQKTLESEAVVNPLLDTDRRDGTHTVNRIRTNHRLEVLAERNLTSLSETDVEDDDDLRSFSSLLTDVTIADLEASYETPDDRLLLNTDRVRSNLNNYRRNVMASVEAVPKSTTSIGEYTAAVRDFDITVNTDLRQLVTAVKKSPNSFTDIGDIRRNIASINDLMPILETAQTTLAETPPPKDRVARYYQQVWERHYGDSSPNYVVSVSPSAASAANQTIQSTIIDSIDPTRTIHDRLQTRIEGIDLPTRIPDTVAPFPTFETPMYEPLVETALEYFLPGVEDIPNNSLTLLKTNPEFIESYLVGLNHEFARELRWREFPTDMRGTYFNRFWDSTAQPPNDSDESRGGDIADIHTWRGTNDNDLGSHLTNPPGDEETLVIVIRGDLLKRYPNTQIYAERAMWTEKPDGVGVYTRETAREPDSNVAYVRAPVPREGANGLAYEARHPVFMGTIAPDITFLGIQLTAADARGSISIDEDPGWFIILEEPVGETRFGLDETLDSDTSPDVDEEPRWEELNWGSVHHENGYVSIADTYGDPNFPFTEGIGATWGKNSAHMAYITWQRPFRVAVHADDLLGQEVSE